MRGMGRKSIKSYQTHSNPFLEDPDFLQKVEFFLPFALHLNERSGMKTGALAAPTSTPKSAILLLGEVTARSWLGTGLKPVFTYDPRRATY